MPVNYMTVSKATEKWNISTRQVQKLCKENRIDGASHFGKSCMISKDAEKPVDARRKSGKYTRKVESENE